MLLGLALLYVGAVLFLNGLWLMGHIDDREIAVINIFVGGLTLLISLFLAFGPGADAGSIKAAGLTLLFTFTYLWVAYNRFHDVDGRGLGWAGLACSSPSRSSRWRLIRWLAQHRLGISGLA